MKQKSLFDGEFDKELSNQYTSKINTPIYEPKNKRPDIIALSDDSRTKRIIRDINAETNISPEEKQFLIRAAERHTVYNYQLIADYYSHARKEMQRQMERQALVIIDFNKAYQYGYIKLAHDIANVYFENYGESEK